MATETKQTCPVCKRKYGVPYIYQHMRAEHGIYGGATGKKRQSKLNGRTEQEAVVREEVAATATLQGLLPSVSQPALNPTQTLKSQEPPVLDDELPSSDGGGVVLNPMDDFKVFLDSDGHIWIAKRID